MAEYPMRNLPTKVMMAACSGNIPEIQEFLKNGGNINLSASNPEFRHTLLGLAIICRQESVVSFLLEAGADPRATSNGQALQELLRPQNEFADTMDLMFFTKRLAINPDLIRAHASKELQDILDLNPLSKKVSLHTHSHQIDASNPNNLNQSSATERLAMDIALRQELPPTAFAPKSTGTTEFGKSKESQPESRKPLNDNQINSNPPKLSREHRLYNTFSWETFFDNFLWFIMGLVGLVSWAVLVVLIFSDRNERRTVIKYWLMGFLIGLPLWLLVLLAQIRR